MSKENNLNDVVKKLKILNKILIFANGDKLEFELTKYANTNERKIIWTLIDGKNKSKDIAKQTNQTQRNVDRFLTLLETVELIEERTYGDAPVKLIDYTPPDWLLLHDTKSKRIKNE